MKNIKKFPLKIIIFTAVNYYSILYERVFVMNTRKRILNTELSYEYKVLGNRILPSPAFRNVLCSKRG